MSGPPNIIDFETAKDRKDDRRKGERRQRQDERAESAKAREKSSDDEINRILGYASPTQEADRLEQHPVMGEAFKNNRAKFLQGARANVYNHRTYYAIIAIPFGVLMALIITAWSAKP